MGVAVLKSTEGAAFIDEIRHEFKLVSLGFMGVPQDYGYLRGEVKNPIVIDELNNVFTLNAELSGGIGSAPGAELNETFTLSVTTDAYCGAVQINETFRLNASVEARSSINTINQMFMLDAHIEGAVAKLVEVNETFNLDVSLAGQITTMAEIKEVFTLDVTLEASNGIRGVINQPFQLSAELGGFVGGMMEINETFNLDATLIGASDGASSVDGECGLPAEYSDAEKRRWC